MEKFETEEEELVERFTIRTVIRSVSRLKFSLYSVLVIKALLPTIYSTVRISLLGELPSSNGVNIASQIAWLSLFFEVLQETLIYPLYSTIGKTVNQPEITSNKIKTGLIVILFLFSVATIILYFAMPWLVRVMAQDLDLFDQTVSYIRKELIGQIFSSVNSFLLIPVELMEMNRTIFSCVLLKLVLTVVLDVTFLSELSFSLKLGVDGVAYSNIISELATCILVSFLLVTQLRPHFRTELNFHWMFSWLHKGLYSGLDSLIRNLVYMLVILRTMNLLDSAGLYWTTNTFIWSYLLLPFLPLSELLRVDTAASDGTKMRYSNKLSGYFVVTLIIVLLWAVTVPGWNLFYRTVFRVEDPEKNVNLTLILFPFYVSFMFGHLLTSVLYGLGYTNYIALKSLVGNILISATWSLTIFNIIPVTLLSVSLMFGGGLLLGFLTSSVLCYIAVKKMNYVI